MTTPPIRAGVIGLGFMGQTHVRGYLSSQNAGIPVQLAAVCDHNPDLLTGNTSEVGNFGEQSSEQLFDPSVLEAFADIDDFLANESINLVSICTHTDSHVDLAKRALSAGKHVIVEKPVALSSIKTEVLAKAAALAEHDGLLCMPAMCMRFWPAWDWLYTAIKSEAYGNVLSASFTRLGSTPTWADSFYHSSARSGGALLDLHIHDVDFIHHCFGAPSAVVSTGSLSHITALYRYDNGPSHVTAEGCWDRSPDAQFTMAFKVNFKHATAEFNLGSEHELVVYTDGKASPIKVSPLTGWEMQLRRMVEAIISDEKCPPVSISEAALVMRTIEAERKSLDTNQCVNLTV